MKNISCELTNMVMIENKENGTVLVQHRRLYWTGITFPGGHIEDGESFYTSAVREVKEETGLDVFDLHQCGTVHWYNSDTKERYIVLLYKTSNFSGELTKDTPEGEIFWVKKEALPDMELSPNFDKYLEIFLNDNLNEAFACYNERQEDPLSFQ